MSLPLPLSPPGAGWSVACATLWLAKGSHGPPELKLTVRCGCVQEMCCNTWAGGWGCSTANARAWTRLGRWDVCRPARVCMPYSVCMPCLLRVRGCPVTCGGRQRDRYERRTREHGGVARAARGGASRGRESAPGVVTRSKPREACSRQVDGMFTVGLSMMAIETPRRLTTALKPLKTHLSSAHIAGT